MNGKNWNIFFALNCRFLGGEVTKLVCRLLYQFMYGKFIKNIEMSIQNLKLGLLKKANPM